MRVVLIIMADVLVLVTALLAVHEYHGFKRYGTFVVPFTDRLVAGGAIAADRREAVLREDRIGHIVGIVLCCAVWIMLSAFFAGLSGFVLFPVAAALLLAALKPEPGDTPENRAQYYNAHKRDIDAMKYSALTADDSVREADQ
ncbi:MAG: hypothetical protein Q4C10_13645 [Clostridia bacterium]|nr:hypothetical protein [Clostridia bacterium]